MPVLRLFCLETLFTKNKNIVCIQELCTCTTQIPQNWCEKAKLKLSYRKNLHSRLNSFEYCNIYLSNSSENTHISYQSLEQIHTFLKISCTHRYIQQLIVLLFDLVGFPDLPSWWSCSVRVLFEGRTDPVNSTFPRRSFDIRKLVKSDLNSTEYKSVDL